MLQQRAFALPAVRCARTLPYLRPRSVARRRLLALAPALEPLGHEPGAMYSRFYPYHEESDEYPEHMAVDFRKLRVSRLRDGRRGGIRASSRPAQRLRPLSPASGAERARRAPSSACARPVAARRRKARGRLPRRGPRGGRLACSWARAVEAAAECRPPWGAARSRGCAAGFPANAHAVVQVKALQRPGWGGSRGLYELVGRRGAAAESRGAIPLPTALTAGSGSGQVLQGVRPPRQARRPRAGRHRGPPL